MFSLMPVFEILLLLTLEHLVIKTVVLTVPAREHFTQEKKKALKAKHNWNKEIKGLLLLIV